MTTHSKKYPKQAHFIVVGFSYTENDKFVIEWDTIIGNINGYDSFKEAKLFALNQDRYKSYNLIGVTEKTNAENFDLDSVNNGSIKVLLKRDIKTQEILSEFCCFLNI